MSMIFPERALWRARGSFAEALAASPSQVRCPERLIAKK
jgi:hypothetical protein